jgi:hypothetical protein
MLTVVVGLVTAAAAFAVVGTVQPSSAAWTDAHTVSVTVTAVTNAAPANFRCVPTSSSDTTSAAIRWDVPVSGRTPSGYRVTAVPVGLSGAAGPFDVTTNALDITTGLLSLGGTWTISVQAYYGASYAAGWKSTASATKTFQMSLGLFGHFAYSCT